MYVPHVMLYTMLMRTHGIHITQHVHVACATYMVCACTARVLCAVCACVRTHAHTATTLTPARVRATDIMSYLHPRKDPKGDLAKRGCRHLLQS